MQNDDAEFVARLKSMTNLEVNWNRESERHALALIEKYRKARAILYSYGGHNEATAHPWWAVVIRNRMGGGAIAAGPFFSRERATEHMEARRHEYGKAAYVFCFSGHASQHYVELCAALAPDPTPKEVETKP